MALLAALLNVYRRPPCLWECSSVQCVWERRISSWLPFAYLSHDTASHAAWAGLGPPPGRAWLFSCLNSSVWLPQRSPELSEGPQQSPSSLWDPPPTIRPVKNPAPQAERRRRGVVPRPALKSSETKTKKRKKEGRKREGKKRKLCYRVDPTLACLSDSTIYGRAWDTAGAKRTVYTQRTVSKDRPSDSGRQRKCWKGGWGWKEGRWRDIKAEDKKKRKRKRRESRRWRLRAHTVKAGDEKWQEWK